MSLRRSNLAADAADSVTAGHVPEDVGAGIWCCEVELAGSPQLSYVIPPAPEHTSVRALVRLHGEPLGYRIALVAPDCFDLGLFADAAGIEFAERIAQHLAVESLPNLESATALPEATDTCPNHVVCDEVVSIVVCTRDRTEVLADCLSRLTALTYPHVEILVVDNAPTDDTTQALVEAIADGDPRFRYLREPRAGLSAARNCGLAAATGTYLAYTDDDVAVDPGWVQGLIRGFQLRPGVGCVTGLVCTASITSAAEAYFDARSPSWSTRCEAEIFDMAENRRDTALYPYSPGIFGTGANFAFDRALLAEVGRFDEALGAGTKTRGGEDLDMFVRMLLAGHAIVYQPAAVVWHHHRADRQALLKQMFGYGTGLSAFVTKYIRGRSTRSQVLRRLPGGARKIMAIRSDTSARLERGTVVPKGAWAHEMAGFAAGPVLYFRAEWSARRRA